MGWILWKVVVGNDSYQLYHDWVRINHDIEEQRWSSKFIFQTYFAIRHNKSVNVEDNLVRIIRNNLLLHKVNGVHERHWRLSALKILWALRIKNFIIHNTINDKICQNYEILLENIDRYGSRLWSRTLKITHYKIKIMCWSVSSRVLGLKSHSEIKRWAWLRWRRWRN